MHFIRTGLIACSALALGLSTSARAAETYTLDPSHTQVVWNISHFGFSNPSGKFASIDGTLSLDETSPANSSVEATIKIANLFTGLEKLNEHLLGEKFFDAAKFPVATFKSTKVVLEGKDAAKVTGDLTLHGVTKPVTLDVKLNKIGENMKKEKTAGFSASLTLKRSDFDMKEYLPGLGDDVKIEIESEANLKQ